MKRRIVAANAAVLACACAVTATSADGLTLEAALIRARARSIVVLAARGRAEEAKARLRYLPVLSTNPSVEGAFGSRSPADSTDFELGVSQTFETGGRGSARREAAAASVSRELAAATDAERRALRDVANAFLRGLHAQERLRLASSAVAYASDIDRIANRRREAGDVAALDTNLAASALGRARAEVRTADADRVVALGELRILLDIPAGEPVSLLGELLQPSDQDELAGYVARALDRPDIQVLQAELREAEAEIRSGRAAAWPELTPSVRYERDQGDRVLWAGLSITLPVFNRGRDQRAAGTARAERIRLELGALSRAVENELRTAFEAQELRSRAASELQANLGALDDNEALARRSYEVGQIGLGEFLLVRRETLEARRAWLDSALEAARARFDLEVAAGGAR